MGYGFLILLHVASATLWGAIVFFLGAFLGPAAAEAGPASGAVMGGLMKRRLNPLLVALGTLAVLSGALLYGLRYGHGAPWDSERIVLTVASLGGLHAYFKGLLVSRPLGERMGAIMVQLSQRPDPALTAELKEIQAKMAKAGRSSAFELLAVLLLMAGHRLAAFF